jgi:hypothetical protein
MAVEMRELADKAKVKVDKVAQVVLDMLVQD